MFNTLKRIEELRNARGWSVYHLAKASGIPQSTIATWYQKGLCPPIDKLEKICDTFGITLSEFFLSQSDLRSLSDNTEIFRQWTLLNKEQQALILEIIRQFNKIK